MKKARLFLKGLWVSAVGWFTPAWLGLASVCITGNAKGFGADLGSEKDLVLAFGVLLLLVWVAAIGPAAYWAVQMVRTKRWAALYALLAVFLLAALCRLAVLFC